jgi:hypothetical protein
MLTRIVADGAGTMEMLVRVGRSKLNKIVLSNSAGTAGWLKVYNTDSTPVPGDGTPILTLWCGLATGSGPAMLDLRKENVALWQGLGVVITASAVDSDTTAPPVGVIVHLIYE